MLTTSPSNGVKPDIRGGFSAVARLAPPALGGLFWAEQAKCPNAIGLFLYMDQPAPIFISYSRRTATAEAQALKAQLGSKAFLDESDIETRADFPERIVHALLRARGEVEQEDR